MGFAVEGQEYNQHPWTITFFQLSGFLHTLCRNLSVTFSYACKWKKNGIQTCKIREIYKGSDKS